MLSFVLTVKVKNNTSYEDCAAGQIGRVSEDWLTLGPALVAVFGLSLLARAVVLAPFVAILPK